MGRLRIEIFVRQTAIPILMFPLRATCFAYPTVHVAARKSISFFSGFRIIFRAEVGSLPSPSKLTISQLRPLTRQGFTEASFCRKSARHCTLKGPTHDLGHQMVTCIFDLAAAGDEG